MELTRIVVYRFRNHEEFRSPLAKAVAILWKNGSGKTALLEALYFAVNAALPPKRAIQEIAKDFQDPFFVRFEFLDESKWPLPYEYLLSADPEKKTYSASIQASSVSRAKFLTALPVRAVLFSPDDTAVLYGAPSDRRDFLDEILSLSDTAFTQIRKNYQTAVRQRNTLLKKIANGQAKASDLDPWDSLVASRGGEYRAHREKIVAFFREHIDFLEWFFPFANGGKRYELRLSYESKTTSENTEQEMREYLQKNRERDIMLGHTYVGPHLDDFFMEARRVGIRSDMPYSKSDQFLSRGENKSLFFALKLLWVEYLEQLWGKKAILLLDDIFSELDQDHRNMILSACKNRQFFLAGQEMPKIPEEYASMLEIRLGE